ncbi:vesicular glutamate transporter 3 [Plakobranchus ocellatus]|uniref:Vesicular glutamate transporter 3 n=1 Tax=Plakobranchus ocellatus TaxID=259542 RepID=A0AAV4DHV6_9GAST|nr:vesicular glutamate transporter 3 [Plakobranchus ocellatus]
MANISYRYVILFLVTIAFTFMFSLRSAFIMTLTHTTHLQKETTNTLCSNSNVTENVGVEEIGVRDNTESSFYHGCTAYNSSRDYVSDFGWTISVMFYSVYYLGMGIGYIAAGSILSKIAAHHVLLGGWYTSALLHLLLPYVFTKSGEAVMLMRLITGFCESVVQPAFVALAKSWVYKGEESTYLSIGLMGSFCSPALASVFVGACLCYVSWNSGLYIIGSILLVWTLLWHLFSYDSPFDCPHIADTDLKRYRLEQKLDSHDKGNKAKGRNVPWRQILTSKPVWAIWIANANKNCNLAAVSSLIPLFFKDVYGIRAADSGLLMIAPFVINTVFVLGSSLISDRIIKSGTLSTTTVRKIMQCTGAAGEAVCMISTLYVPDWRLSVLCLTLAQAMAGLCFPGFASNITDLTPHFSGAVAGVSFAGTFMAFVITGIASLIPENNEASGGVDKWTVVFWINAGIAALSSVFYLIFASGEVQPWGLEEVADEEKEPLKPMNPSLNFDQREVRKEDLLEKLRRQN